MTSRPHDDSHCGDDIIDEPGEINEKRRGIALSSRRRPGMDGSKIRAIR